MATSAPVGPQLNHYMCYLLCCERLTAAVCCRCLIECRDEYKYNVEAVELLIRNHLVNMQQYDLHLAQVSSWIPSRLNHCHLTFSLGLVGQVVSSQWEETWRRQTLLARMKSHTRTGLWSL